jgi:hypothetical protein
VKASHLFLGLSLLAWAVPSLAQTNTASGAALLTLTGGRTTEVFHRDTLQHTGGYAYNTVTGKAFRLNDQVKRNDTVNVGMTKPNGAAEFQDRDLRIGRFLSIDPLAAKYPHNSPYAFSENRVLDAFELEGRESCDIRMRQDDVALLKGEITKEEYLERKKHGAIGALLGAFGAIGIIAAPEIIAWGSGMTLVHGEILNEGGALVWGIFLDEEYPAPAASDNLARAARYGIKNLTEALTQTKRVHIDIGGHVRYPDALNYITDDVDYAGKAIPNHVQGLAEDNLKRVKDASVDLFHIEDGPMNADVFEEISRTLKTGGEVKYSGWMIPEGGWAQYAEQFGLKVTESRRTFVAGEGGVDQVNHVTMTKQ